MRCSIKTEGITVRSYDYGDGHRVVVFYTRDRGKIKAVARGSRKTKSRFASSLEPLSENVLMFYRKPGSGNGLFTLTGARILDPRSTLRSDMRLFGYGSLMLEGVDILNEEEDPDIGMYGLLRGGLSELGGGNTSSAAWLFMFRALKLAGYRLNMFSCVSCGTKNPPAASFSPAEGGIICPECPGSGPVWRVSGKALECIRKLSGPAPLSEGAEKEIGNIIEKYIKYQLDRDLNSTEFLNIFKNRCTFRT